MSDQETVDVYAAQADEYAAMTDEDNADDPALTAFIAVIPSNGHVLDLGCGPGAAAGKMAQAGLQVTATDAVSEMVALASQHLGVNAVCASFDDIDGTDIYDGIWANFSLLHATKADMPRHLAALSKSLKPNGIFHIGVKEGIGEKRDRIGRKYSYYKLDELNALLEDAGLSVKDHTSGCSLGMDGVMANWICVRAYG
jgi:SAM-dependent methyltransferase